MATISLGAQPTDLNVHLTTGADFRATVRLDQDWPAGATLKLVFPTTNWAATISGRNATFDVDKATADTITSGVKVTLVYTSGTVDETWAIGSVVRHG